MSDHQNRIPSFDEVMKPDTLNGKIPSFDDIMGDEEPVKKKSPLAGAGRQLKTGGISYNSHSQSDGAGGQKNEKWLKTQADMAKKAREAGLPEFTNGNERLGDAIQRLEKAGYKFDHFTGNNDPTGDRTVTIDMENLVKGLKTRLSKESNPSEKSKIQKELKYWESELIGGMTAEEWKRQTGENDPIPQKKDEGILAGVKHSPQTPEDIKRQQKYGSGSEGVIDANDDPVKAALHPLRKTANEAFDNYISMGSQNRQVAESTKQANYGSRLQINANANFQAKLKKDNEKAQGQLVETANNVFNKVIPNGKVAQEYLQKKASENNGELPSNNETVNLAIIKANRYEDLKKSLGDDNDLTQVAVDLARQNDSHLDKQISVIEGGVRTGQSGLGTDRYENKIPQSQQGRYIDELLHDEDVALIAQNNPALKEQFDYLKNGGLYERFPEYGETVARNMISREYEKRKANIVANPIFNKSKYLDKLSDELFADNPALKKIVDERLKGNWEGKVDTPGIVDEFGTSASHTYKGMANTLKNLIGAGDSEQERIYKGLDKQYGNVSSGVTGWKKDVGQAANFMGMIAAMATGGIPLKAIGASPAVVNAINTGVTFYDEELNNWTMKYPGEQWKAQIGAIASTGAYMVAHKAFPSSKISDIVAKKMEPSIAEALSKLESGEVSTAVRDNLVKKYGKVLLQTVKGSAEGASQMVAITGFQNALDQTLGLDGKAFQKYHPQSEGVDVARNMMIGLAFPKFIESMSSRNATAASLSKIADYPQRHLEALDLMKSDGTITEAEYAKKVEDVNFLKDTKAGLKDLGVPEKNQSRFLLEAMNGKYLKEKAESSPEGTLKRNRDGALKAIEEVKQGILDGKNPDEIITTQEQKTTEENLKNKEIIDKSKSEIESMEKENDLDNEGFDIKIKELDKEDPSYKIKKEKIEQQRDYKNAEYKLAIEKLKSKTQTAEEKHLNEVADQALNKVSNSIVSDEVALKRAKEVYGEDVVKEAIKRSLKKELADNEAELAKIENPSQGDIDFFKEQEEEIKQKHNEALGKGRVSVTMPGELNKPNIVELKKAEEPQPIDQQRDLDNGNEPPIEEVKSSENEQQNIQEPVEGNELVSPETVVEPTPTTDTNSGAAGKEPPATDIEEAVDGVDPDSTKIANAINDQFIKDKFGVDALNGIVEQLQDTDLSKTYGVIKDKIQKGTIDPKITRDKVLTQKSGNAADQAVLLYDMAQLKGQEKNLRRQIIESIDHKEKEELQRALAEIQNQMMDNALANRYVGRDWHNIGKIRQQWISNDYNIIDMQQEYMASKGISELTEEQKAEIQGYHDSIKDLEAQRDKAKEDLDKSVAEVERLKAENDVLKKLKGKSNKDARVKRTDEQIAKSNERIQKAKDELKNLRHGMNDITRVVPKTAALIGRIAAEKVYQGVIEFGNLVKDILDDVKDIFPEWTEKDVAAHLLNEAPNYEKYYEAGKSYDLSNKELRDKIKAYNDLNKQYALKQFEWQKDRRSDLMKNRSTKEKIIDGILRWQRFAILSYPTTLVKLGAVVVHQAVLKPLKFAIQKFITAPISRGLGIHSKQGVWAEPTWRSLGKYYSEMIRNFSLANLKEQFGGIDTKEILYGDRFMYDEWAAAKGLLEMPGRSHGYIKSFIKNPEFKFAQENLATQHISKMAEFSEKLKDDKLSDEEKANLQDEYNKWDVTNPDVMERINKLSLEHGKWSILMNDNNFTKKFQAWTKDNGFSGALIKSELPIIKIPLNYIYRAFAIKYGLVRAIAGKGRWESKENHFPGLVEMVFKGTKDLTPKQADILGRCITLGSMGAMFFATGYLLRNQIHHNDDGSIDMFGTHINKNLVHSPEFESLLSGATTGHQFDKKIGKGADNWLESFVESDIDIAKKSPFVSMLKYGFTANVASALLSKDDGTVLGKIRKATFRKISDMVIPGALKQSAGAMDVPGKRFDIFSTPTKRTPTGSPFEEFLQSMESGIPFLRQNVPKASSSGTEFPRSSHVAKPSHRR